MFKTDLVELVKIVLYINVVDRGVLIAFDIITL
jgi:hypothetical protein